MKKLIPALIFLLSSPSLFAQWKCFTPGTDQYFTNNYGYVRGMRIDSVGNMGTDQVYCPFKTVRMSYGEYLGAGNNIDTNGGSWLGEFIISQPDGSFLFDNIYSDTVLIKTTAAVGDSWAFYDDSSNDFYLATVTSLDTMSILGNLDSIKRIRLTAYQSGVYAPSDSFDNTEIILSKANGFVQVIDLYNFPYHAPNTMFIEDDIDFVVQRSLVNPSYYINHNQFYNNYVALPTTDTPGKYNSVFKRVDFTNATMAQLGGGWDVGDVIQRTRCWISNPGCIPYQAYRYTDTIVSKTVTVNGVHYFHSGELANRVSFNQYVFTPTTGSIFYSANEYFLDGEMPEEIHFDTSTLNEYPGWFYYYYPYDTSYCLTGPLYHRVSANLLQLGYIGIANPVTILTYKQGLGNVRGYHYHYDGLTGEINDSTIKFFIHGGDSCGTSFTFPDTTLAATNILTENTIKLYPNPAYTELTIESPASGHSVSLINTLGQVVYRKAGCEQKESIDVQHFAGGIYYLKVESAGIGVLTRKVSLQH